MHIQGAKRVEELVQRDWGQCIKNPENVKRIQLSSLLRKIKANVTVLHYSAEL